MVKKRKILATIPSVFSPDKLREIFQFEPGSTTRLISRENSELEFKESFNWNSRAQYARTIAAFANNRGGYLVFGVKDKPRVFKGLLGTAFIDLDPHKVTSFLNEHFSPEIQWEMTTHEIDGKKAGIFYVFESGRKPVVSSKNNSELREAAIYFRYRGQTKDIKYSELITLLDEQRKKDQEVLLRHLRKFASLDVTEIATMDLKEGLVETGNKRFLIDDTLLKKIKFVKEGKFSEVDGAPTLRLMGDVTPVDGVVLNSHKEKLITKAIRSSDIVNAFINNQTVDNPLEYIKQIPYEQSAYLPYRFLMKQAKLTAKELVPIVEALQVRGQTKSRFLARVKNESESFYQPLPQNNKSERVKAAQEIKSKTFPSIGNEDQAQLFLKGVLSLKDSELDAVYLKPIFKNIFDTYFSAGKGQTADLFRKSLCHADNHI